MDSKRFVVAVLCALCVVLAGCAEEPPAPAAPMTPAAPQDTAGQTQQPRAARADQAVPSPAAISRAAAAAHPSEIRFTDVSERSGIHLENVSGDPEFKFAIPENIGQGAAAFDYDLDGDLDLFVANGDVFEGQTPRAEPRPALYRNDGDLRFTDVTEAAGLTVRAWMHGAYAIDFDGDGDRDLYVTVYLGKNRFFRNDGGRFTDVSATWGGEDAGPSTAAAFFDADQDGDLDLYVGNYVEYDPKDPFNGGRPCDWKGLAVSCGPRGMPAGVDRFYENVDGRLIEATERFGFNAKPAYTLCVIAGDADGDGLIDLFVANDSVANYHFHNLGNGRFEERGRNWETATSGAGHNQAGMGADFADFDGDGRLDYYVTHFSHDFNTLYRNERLQSGRTLFSDVTDIVGLKAPTMRFLSWGTAFCDFDHDGDRDIVIASGHVYPQVDSADLETSYAQRNQVFLNDGLVGNARLPRFREILPAPGSALAQERVSRGLVAADFDNDGDLDVFTVEMDARPTLLRNDLDTSNAWIGIELVGSSKNREAIGAHVTLVDADEVVRVDQRTYGESYFSTMDPRLHFGLGRAKGPARAIVTWPGGARSVHEQLATGRYHRLEAPVAEERPR